MFALVSAILVILIFILFLPIKIEISVKENKLNIRAVFLGITVCKYKYNKKDKPSESNAPEKKVAELEKDTVLLGTRIKQYVNRFKSAVELLRKYVSIAKINIIIDVGTGEAATTAISVGTLWGAIYGLLGIIGSVVYINEHNVQINPVYASSAFSAEGVCIIKSRIAYIIFIVITILMKIKSRKGKEE